MRSGQIDIDIVQPVEAEDQHDDRGVGDHKKHPRLDIRGGCMEDEKWYARLEPQGKQKPRDDTEPVQRNQQILVPSPLHP